MIPPRKFVTAPPLTCALDLAVATVIPVASKNVQPVIGQTLNATVFHAILGDSWFGQFALMGTLALEAGLLFVAANTGFVAGPNVLANMAVDVLTKALTW